MEGFTKYSPLDRTVPKVSGAYNIVIIARRGVPVVSVAYYSMQHDKWVGRTINEYGYAEEFRLDSNNISYFKHIEGIEFEIIPESYDIKISGVEEDEDD